MIGTLFGPARALMGRLSYTPKIVAVVLVLAVPLAWCLYLYLEAEGAQIDFSAKERDGVAYLVPVAALAGEVVQARSAAVDGRVDAAAVEAAWEQVAATEQRLGGSLATAESFEAARAAVEGAVGGKGSPRQVYDAWTAASEAVVTLATSASDGSNLTLDPDLDSYYVMDTVAFRMPRLLEDLTGTVTDLALANARRGIRPRSPSPGCAPPRSWARSAPPSARSAADWPRRSRSPGTPGCSPSRTGWTT
ncbi:MAG TPA: hypothetical protein VK402_04740 [Blastococcus sp.]|nr:hypothetical protein [Blastococcus sp.]